MIFTKANAHPRAFTLVEMLVVMGIIALLLTAVVPAVVGISRGQGVTRAIDDITATFEQARGQAMARNTWVYACFSNPTAGSGSSNQLIVMELESKDGSINTSTANGVTTLNTTNADLQLLFPPIRINNAAATLVDSNNKPIVSTVSCAYPVGGSSVQFDTIIAFSPQGEALLDPGSRSVNDWLQLQIAELRGGVRTTNTAELKLSGSSGQTVLIRK